MHSNKNKIFLGILILFIVLLILFLFKKDVKDVKHIILSNNHLIANQIEFIRIEGNNYKWKSKPQKLALDALQTLPPKSFVMLKIEKPENVFFSNKKDTIVSFLKTKIENGEGLPYVDYELLSTWEFEKLKLAPIYIEVYFGTTSQLSNYNYETKFISYAIQ